MPDAARTADAKILAVPVTIQGSKIVEGTDHRELFTETTKTELVFDTGAALHLQARVVAGQSLFLRNEVTGREILCRVIEAPAKGQTGCTDLEFTVPEAGFWDATAEQIQAAAEKIAAEKTAAEQAAAKAAETAAPTKSDSTAESSAHGGGHAPVDSTLAMMGAPASTMTVPPVNPRVGEELVPAHEAVSESSAAPSVASDVAHQEVVPARAQTPAQPASKSKEQDAGPEFNLAKFEDTLAALLDGDARRARRAASGKDKAAAKPGGEAATPATQAETDAEAPVEAEVIPAGPTLEQRLTTGKGAVIVGTAASVVIAVCLGLIWRAVFYPASYEIERPAAATIPSRLKPPMPSGKPTSTTSAAASASTITANAKPSGATSMPAMVVAKNSLSPSVPVAVVNNTKPAATAHAPTGPRVIVSRNAITADSGGPENVSKPGGNTSGNIPARIVSEIQPTFPSWAKELDVDGNVMLDVTIDAKGNITDTKVLSGPRPLQHAAQQAIGLWIFEPAKLNGVPVATHMTLTVEFQR